MIKVIKYYELNRISRILVIAIITYIVGILIKREYEESKTVYNFCRFTNEVQELYISQ